MAGYELHFHWRACLTIPARTVVIATGARYRRPSLANLGQFEGAGVYYNATFMEAQLCDGDEVIVEASQMSIEQALVRIEISNPAYGDDIDYDSITFSPQQARNLGRALLAAAELVNGAHTGSPSFPQPVAAVVNKGLLS